MNKILLCLLITFANISYGQIYLSVSSPTNLFSGPNYNGYVVQHVEKGEKLLVTAASFSDENGDVYFRVFYNCASGWIYMKNVVNDDAFYNALQKFVDYNTKKGGSDVAKSKIAPNDSNPKKLKEDKIKHKSYCINPFKIKTIKLIKSPSGTFQIPCKINGIPMNFIFDTGASNVSISLTEALFMLKNGNLNTSDIYGTEYYKIANGEIHEGTVIVIREIEFDGLKIFNVRASIVHNDEAPLLLGQTAISMLGTIQIDYATNTLTIINNKPVKK